MIEIAMAIALSVAPTPDDFIWRVDEDQVGPYVYLSQPCTQLQAGYPDLVDRVCIPDVQVLQGGLGAQVELGFFRARITQGEFYQGGYIAEQSFQFLEQMEGLEIRTARGAYSLVCVEQSSGLIERNGPVTEVVVPAGQQTGHSTITLRSEGECSLGWEREVMTLWAFSDSPLPWESASDFDTSLTGWDDGQNSVTVGQITFTGTVIQMADYGEGGVVEYEVSMDSATRAAIAATDTSSECSQMLADRTMLDSGRGFALGGVGGALAGSLTNPNLWCDEARPGVVSIGPVVVAESSWRATDVSEYGAFYFFVRDNPNRVYRTYQAPGTPDRFEVEGAIWLSSSLTSAEDVRDMVWVPEQRPFSADQVEGLCVDDLSECWQECADIFDPGWNPVDNVEMVIDFIYCLVVPTTDIGELVEAIWEDIESTVGHQSIQFIIDTFGDLLAAPAYYARDCGAIVETDLAAVELEGSNQEFSTCDLPEDTRQLIFTLSGLLIAASFIFMCVRLFFYALKQRNMLIGAQMMEDDYARADEAKNG